MTKSNDTRERYFRRKLALRRLLLGPDGHLTRDGRTLAAWMKRLCWASRGQKLIYRGTEGIDPVETVAIAARREVWDEIVEMLNLDQYETTNIQEDE